MKINVEEKLRERLLVGIVLAAFVNHQHTKKAIENTEKNAHRMIKI